MRKGLVWLLLYSSVAVAWCQQPEPTKQIAQAVEAISAFWFLLIVYLVIAGWVTLLTSMFPDWTQRKAQQIPVQARQAFWFGLVIAFVLILLMVLFGAIGGQLQPPAKDLMGLLFLVLLIVLLSLLLVGWVPVTMAVGQRVLQVIGREGNLVTFVLVGALVLHLAVFMPIVGWALWLYWAFVAIGLLVVKS